MSGEVRRVANTEPKTSSVATPAAAGQDVLELLVSYRRAELANLQTRLERADAKAGGGVTAGIAVLTLAATGLAALQDRLSEWDVIIAGVGGMMVVGALLAAVQVRDTADRHNWFGKRFVKVVKPTKNYIDRILALRAAVRQIELPLGPAPDVLTIQRAIAMRLATRIDAASDLARLMDRQAQAATLVLAGGICLLTVAGALALNHI